MELEFLEALKDDWRPVSKPARLGWLIFYALFLIYAFTSKEPYLFIDNVFLPIHEGGHLLFGWLGHTLGIAGGTILQLFVPLAIALYFTFARQVPGAAFAAFFFFENFLNISTYMADARQQALPLVTVGDPDNVEHDWNYLFGQLGVLQHDTAIAGVVRFLGWLGMLCVVGWFAWRARAASSQQPQV